jgi:nucleoside 2-deoxyribosyltransferase
MEQLAIKEQSEEELRREQEELRQEQEELKDKLVRAERKAIRVNKFMHRVVIKEKKLEWIYIATTKFSDLRDIVCFIIDHYDESIDSTTLSARGWTQV